MKNNIAMERCKKGLYTVTPLIETFERGVEYTCSHETVLSPSATKKIKGLHPPKCKLTKFYCNNWWTTNNDYANIIPTSPNIKLSNNLVLPTHIAPLNTTASFPSRAISFVFVSESGNGSNVSGSLNSI